VGDWDIYLTSEVAAWLENLQATDAKTAGLADDAIYALSRTGPALGRPLVDTITASKIKWLFLNPAGCDLRAAVPGRLECERGSW
jgi:hypothetical protein